MVAIYSSAGNVPNCGGAPAVRQFGGIRLFARSASVLDKEVDRILGAIQRVCAENSGLTPSMLRHLVQEELDTELPQRIFSALMGRCLRDGKLDTFVCEGSQGAPFRVVVHNDRISEFSRRVCEVTEWLSKERVLQISEVRDRYFGSKQKGGWTQGMYIAARVVRLGLGKYRDQYSVLMPNVIANAILSFNKPIHPFE